MPFERLNRARRRAEGRADRALRVFSSEADLASALVDWGWRWDRWGA